MDRLTAFVAIAHMRLRLDYLKRHPELLGDMMATPILQGLGSHLAKLEHNLETAAGPLAQKIARVETLGLDAIKRAHVKVDGISSRVNEVESYVAAIGGNGGDPLDDSSTSSAASQADTSVDAALPASAPEPLTVNGVSIEPR